jgi:hypothetical protein
MGKMITCLWEQSRLHNFAAHISGTVLRDSGPALGENVSAEA